jgi:hypothetical protein
MRIRLTGRVYPCQFPDVRENWLISVSPIRERVFRLFIRREGRGEIVLASGPAAHSFFYYQYLRCGFHEREIAFMVVSHNSSF